MVIDQFAILHADITCVHYNNSVCNDIAYFYLTRRVGALCDAQFCCCFFCSHRCCCFNFFRIVSAFRCRVRCYYVHDLACVNVYLRNYVSISEFSAFSRCEVKRFVTQIGMVVIERAILDANITFIFNGNGICYRSACFYAARRARCLCDAKLCCCIFCCDCCCCFNFFRIISAFRCRVRCYYVHDLTRVDVFLCHCVSVFEACFFTWSKSKGLVTKICVIIFKHAVFDAHVACVLHYHCVCNSVAYCYVFRWFRALCDAQFCCCIFCCDCCFCFNFFRIISAFRCRVRCYYVHDLACVDIFLGHFVSVFEACFFTWSKSKGLVTKICVIIFKHAVFDAHVACVLHYDCVCNSVAYCNFACRVCILRDAQLCCCFFCRYFCCRSDFCRIISTLCCRVRCYYVHDLACVDIFLGHFVSVFEACFFTWSKSKGLVTKICVIIFKHAVFDAYVACVLH